VELEENSEQVQAFRIFGKVFGAGPSTVRKWFALGYRTLEDLRDKATLTSQQQIGLRYYEEFQKRIPRAEVQMIASLIIAHIQNLDPDYICEVCGSYRRGKSDCGDMDILVTHPREKKLHGVLMQLVPILHAANIITDDLTGIKNGLQDKYMGVCWSGLPGAVHRRIDIQVVPLVEWPFALLYFTGSGYFNRSMRLWAQRHGFSLSEHALVRRYGKPHSTQEIKGDPIPGIRTEKEVFDALGLEYKAPHERDV
jgi:DNA polymerase lambda